MMKYLSFLIKFIVVISISSCVKQLESPEKIIFSGQPQAPLISSEITFLDLKKPSDTSLIIVANVDSGYYQMSFGPIDFDFPEAGTIISVAKNGINESNFTPLPIIAPGAQTLTIPFSIPIDLAQGDTILSNTAIKQVFFSDGNLELELQSSSINSMVVVVTFLGVVDKVTNKPLVFNYPLNALNNFKQKNSTSLADYKLVLNGGTTLGISLAVTVNSASTGSLHINSFAMNNIVWSRIDGKIGNIAVKLGNSQLNLNSLVIQPFSSSENSTGTGTVFFQNPSMTIKFENSFGLPANLILKPLIALDKNSQVLSDRTNDLGNTPFFISKPSDPDISTATFPSISSQPVSPDILRDLLNKGPKFISYGIVLSVSGANTTNSDFILSTSKIKTHSSILLPLNGYLRGFKIQSIIKAPDFSSLNGSVSGNNFTLDVDTAVIHFDFENKFPLDIISTIEFLNADSIPIPSIALNISIAGGNLDAQGNVLSAVTTKNNLFLDKQQFTDLKNQCKSLRISGYFNTTGANDAIAKSVKFYSTNKLKISISTYLNANGEYDLSK